jgi:hypothetical protein
MGEQEVYENVDFAAKEDLLRWLDLDYTQVNTAHHLRNKVRLTQSPNCYSSVKDDFRSGENFSWEEAGVLYCTARVQVFVCVCVCGKGRIHERWHANCMPIQRHLWSCGENCISALRACCSLEAGWSCPGGLSFKGLVDRAIFFSPFVHPVAHLGTWPIGFSRF